MDKKTAAVFLPLSGAPSESNALDAKYDYLFKRIKMKNLILITIGIVGGLALISSVVIVHSAGTENTIEGCIGFLPAGKSYSFNIAGGIDTTGTAPKMVGSFTLSDPTLPAGHTELPEEAKDFASCVAALIY
jgi:hypothetical protein